MIPQGRSPRGPDLMAKYPSPHPSQVPKSWRPRLEKMDYIWVPTQFHYDTFNRYVRSEKLRILPETVDTDFFDPKRLLIEVWH